METKDTTEALLPTEPDDLFKRLDSLVIPYQTVTHPPVYTVEEAKRLRGEIRGAHIKNLFLRDKKRRMWLLVALESQRLDLKSLGAQLNAKSLSFANADRLFAYLGVRPGSVTPFAVINDKDRAVQVLLDEAILSFEAVNCHPLVNWMTTSIRPTDLLKFLDAEDHPPQLLNLKDQ